MFVLNVFQNQYKKGQKLYCNTKSKGYYDILLSTLNSKFLSLILAGTFGLKAALEKTKKNKELIAARQAKIERFCKSYCPKVLLANP